MRPLAPTLLSSQRQGLELTSTDPDLTRERPEDMSTLVPHSTDDTAEAQRG